jgi:hypothetical protein
MALQCRSWPFPFDKATITTRAACKLRRVFFCRLDRHGLRPSFDTNRTKQTSEVTGHRWDCNVRMPTLNVHRHLILFRLTITLHSAP